MDFDHRSDTAKLDDVATMFNARIAKARIVAEIAKCDVVCANCHRVRTMQRIRQRLSTAS